MIVTESACFAQQKNIACDTNFGEKYEIKPKAGERGRGRGGAKNQGSEPVRGGQNLDKTPGHGLGARNA